MLAEMTRVYFLSFRERQLTTQRTIYSPSRTDSTLPDPFQGKSPLLHSNLLALP